MNVHPNCFDSFSKLGAYLRDIDLEKEKYNALKKTLIKAEQTNGWFTQKNCVQALSNWGNTLRDSALEKWLGAYDFGLQSPKNIGLVLAGNIPLVGWHDVLCVLASGHRARVKLSSSDPYLIPFLYEKLKSYNHDFWEGKVSFIQDRLTEFDAVIATGSNNAARYFKQYFGKVPHLIRQNRNGVAVLSGKESKEELDGLAKDIVSYFGLGCRNISKVYIPQGYDLNLIFGALYPYSDLMNSAKYANNYDYNKAVFLMSEFDFLDNGFYLLMQNESLSSPIACLHYSYYKELNDVDIKRIQNKDSIQCLCSHLPLEQAIPFGKAQQPELWNYADGKDTLTFLLNL